MNTRTLRIFHRWLAFILGIFIVFQITSGSVAKENRMLMQWSSPNFYGVESNSKPATPGEIFSSMAQLEPDFNIAHVMVPPPDEQDTAYILMGGRNPEKPHEARLLLNFNQYDQSVIGERSLMASGWWAQERGANFLDGGAHFYGCYACADGKFVSVGAIELPFMKVLVEKMDLPESWLERHMDRESWPELKAELAARFATRPQAEWCALLEGTDACFAPVLPVWEAHEHPHALARHAFIRRENVVEPAPAPRFSRTKPDLAK